MCPLADQRTRHAGRDPQAPLKQTRRQSHRHPRPSHWRDTTNERSAVVLQRSNATDIRRGLLLGRGRRRAAAAERRGATARLGGLCRQGLELGECVGHPGVGPGYRGKRSDTAVRRATAERTFTPEGRAEANHLEQDELKLLRLRTKKQELVIVPDPKYLLIVVHDTPPA